MFPKTQFDRIMETLEDIKDLLAQQNEKGFAEQYLDNSQLLSILKISKRTAQTWREAGLLPYAQLGSRIYYRMSDLSKLFEAEFKKPRKLKKREQQTRRKPLKKNTWVIKV